MDDIFDLEKTAAPAPAPEPAPEPEPLELGIHFGLDEDTYHADPGLGSTSIVELATSPPRFQYKRMRPKLQVETEAMIWGRAFHCRVLEGREAFDYRYAKVPTPKDFPDSLTTTDSIKDFLREHGQKLTGRKEDLIQRAKDIDECPPIFDEILEKWHDEHPDHQNLDDRQVQEIEDAVNNMQREPILNAVMQAGTLMDGAAELSIIYEVDGIRRKARLDYALPPTKDRSASLGIDLKSYTTFKSGTPEGAAIKTIYEKAYEVQAAYYFQGIKEARSLLEQGKVFGDAPHSDFAKAFLFAEEFRWVWIMLRRDNGMVPTIISTPVTGPMFEHADAIIASALDEYKTYMSRFGPDQLWTPPPRMPRVIGATDFPSYNRGIAHEQPEDR